MNIKYKVNINRLRKLFGFSENVRSTALLQLEWLPPTRRKKHKMKPLQNKSEPLMMDHLRKGGKLLTQRMFVITFLILTTNSLAYGFESSFNSMGLGHEDTFEPSFQTSFLGEVDNVYLKEIDKTYESNLDSLDSNAFENDLPDKSDYPLQKYQANMASHSGDDFTAHHNKHNHKAHWQHKKKMTKLQQNRDSLYEFSKTEDEVLTDDVGVTAEDIKTPVNGLENSAKRARYIGPLSEVTAVAGERAVLPCDVRPTIPGDTTIIVLFYHGAVGTPVYSLDARDSSVYEPWSDENTLGTRAKFDLNLEPPGLVIDPALPSDENLYRCRVDFRSSPTRNSRVRLTVIEPPERVTVLNEQGLEASGVIGPYAVGERVRLRCDVLGGRPRPTVSWWHEDVALDSESEQQSAEVTSNTLILPPLQRSDLYKILTCQGSNNNLTIPEATTVTLDVIFPPYSVQLSGLEEPLVEGSHYEVSCEARGSRPPAILTWWRGDAQIQPVDDQILVENNVSRSRLRLEARVEDQGSSLTCRAENPQIPNSVLQDKVPLEIHFSPRLHLAAGVSLNMNNIREGADAYFECSIKANPKVFKVQWSHNGVELHHNVSAGIILSNQSLVLQKVSRSSSGAYVCSATNARGDGVSEPLELNVKFAPVCRDLQQAVYGGGKNEHLNVSCAVHAHPPPSSFRWAFNSSSEVNDIEHKRYSVVGEGVSQVWYTPRSHLDYGSLLCWATNDVGTQLEPCVFHIIHASSPEPVHNCSVSDVGRSSASVRCHAGWDGGLPQTFTLSVSQGERSATAATNSSRKGDPRVLANTSSSPKPEFAVTGLESGTQYVLTITAVNSRGQSFPVSLAIQTAEDKAMKHTSPVIGTMMPFPPILAVVLGVTVSLLFMCIILVVVVRSRRSVGRNEVKMTVYPIGKEAESPTLHAIENKVITEFDSTAERSPDLIPDDRPGRGAKVQCYAGHDIKSSAMTASTASTVSSSTRRRRGSSDSNSSTGEIAADAHLNSLLQVKQSHNIDVSYEMDRVAYDDDATKVLLHGEYRQHNSIDPDTTIFDTADRPAYHCNSFDVKKPFPQNSSSKLLEDDVTPLGLTEPKKQLLGSGEPIGLTSDPRSKQLQNQSSRPPYSISPTPSSNIFPHPRSSLVASTPETKLSSDPTGSLQQRSQHPHFPAPGCIPLYRSSHNNTQSMSPPPIPTVTTPPTPSSSIYHSLPRGNRYTGRNGPRNLETTPYPSNSSAFSTIVRTKSPNLGTISTRGSDACNRESSV
ncbi:uncharacterized protein LOC108677033 [Hyalella azteca]|uniref:Uncharacterized protein LOC108677033 n=1 Tax=Hyalella azteca TaxID=294128 RepID=A0A979FK05_HYAAZ|nr:uncharacterized protein LOC108677033 [Hyalella azteca]